MADPLYRLPPTAEDLQVVISRRNWALLLQGGFCITLQVEGELDPEPTEEALDVIGRLGESVGHEVDAPPFQLPQRLRTRLVAVGDTEPVAGAVVVGQPFPP